MRYAINGLLSLTCDGNPILGESEVDGLWTAAAVWIKEGPGVGRAVAEWMTHGHSEIDLHHSDIARFHPHQKRREHTRLRTTESFIKTYGIIHPAEQYESDRDQRLSPDARLAAEARRGLLRDRRLGAAVLVRVQRRAARGVRRRGDAARARVGLALVEPDHQRRAPAHARGGRGDRPVGVLHLRHHRARARSTSSRAPAWRSATCAVGKVVYTPVLDAKGGFRSDLTVMRLGDDHFRVVTGGAHGMADRAWFAGHLPDDEATTLTDLTDEVSTIGIWGPRARDILSSLTADDVSDAGFGFLTCREITRPGGRSRPGAGLAHLLRRRARLGALRADGRGRRAVGGAARGGRPARRGAGRHRRLRHDRPDREGLPRLRRRARRRAHHRRGRHAAAQGQGGRLRRQGGLPRAAGRARLREAAASCARSPSTTTRRRAA